MKNGATIALKPSISLTVRPSLYIGCLYVALLFTLSLIHGYSILDYVHLGSIWAEHNRAGTWGYDGQFYYQLARDPFHAYQFMDNAPYRYQRLFYPVVVSFFSLGIPFLIPYLMLLVNIAAIVGSVEIVSQLLVKRHMSPWLSLPVGLYFGQAAAVTFDTAEPFAIFLLCLGFWLLEEKRVSWSALFMGLAALSRDVVVVFAAGYAIFFFCQRRWKDSFWFAGLGVLPLLLWLLAISLIFGQTGLTFSPPFEHTPFAGIFAFAQAPHKFWLLLALVFVPTVVSAFLLLWELIQLGWRRSWHALPLLAIWLANLWMIVYLSRFSFLELISCGRIASPLMLAGIFYGLTMKSKVTLWGLQYYAVTFCVFLAGIFVAASSFIM